MMMRDAGKPRDVLQGLHDGKTTGNVSVPCEGCVACCKSPHITVQLSPEEADRLPRHHEHNGRVVLDKREDGACFYLDSNNRCTVYDIRPRVCRMYDCRLWAIVGITPLADPEWSARIQSWQFDLSQQEDRELVTALRDAASKDGADEQTAGDLLRRTAAAFEGS